MFTTRSTKCLMLGVLGSKSLRGRSVANKAPGGIGPTQTWVGNSLKKRPCVAVMAVCKWMLSGDTVTMLTIGGKFLRCFFLSNLATRNGAMRR